MTNSTHTYTAYLIGSPDLELSVKGGRIKLDAGSAPHVQGTIDVPFPGHWDGTGWVTDEDTLEALDPREDARIRIEVDATFATETQHREFDLSLRDRSIQHADGSITLDLASDESLLADYAPLATDQTPLNYQSSLRDVVDYVLDEAIPGASLEAGSDVAVPALADSQNLIRNPRCGVNTTDWFATWSTGGLSSARGASGGPSDAPTYFGIQATGGATTGGYVFLDQSTVSVTVGKVYELSAYVRAQGSQKVSIDGIQYNDSGTIVSFVTPVQVTPANAWVRVSTKFTATATKLRPRVTMDGTMTFGAYADVTGWRLSETTGDHARDVLYFDGGFTDTAQYDYGWTQTAHASISTRKRLVDAATPDALTWKAGQSALDFLVPLVQRFGLRLVCNEAREWTLRDEEYVAPGSLSVVHAVNLIDGTDSISRDSGLWFDAAVTVYKWTDSAGIQQERTDAYALTVPYSRLRTFQKTTPYPGPGFSEYAVRRAQGRGREVTATVVANWTGNAEQPALVSLQDAPIQVGNTQSVEYDLSNDRMTATLRTTELPAGAIDLETGTVNALTGTVNAL